MVLLFLLFLLQGSLLLFLLQGSLLFLLLSQRSSTQMRLGRLSHVHVRGMRVRPCEEVNGLAKAGACVRRLRQDAGGRMCVQVQFDVRAWSHQAAWAGW